VTADRLLWTSDLTRAHRLAPAIESAGTWVNSHNPQDPLSVIAGRQSGRPGAEAGHVDIGFYTKTRAVHIAAGDTPAPRFGAGAVTAGGRDIQPAPET
jgi:acyl-CoA reductase-like NAD-dependent aldehyde dehydrogenase